MLLGQQGLRLEVLSGDGAFVDVNAREGTPVVVSVRDSSDRTVPNAKVTFTLPFSGPGGTFAGGGREMVVTSDSMGSARMPGIKPNREEGRFNIKVKAEIEGGRFGSVVVSQSNTSALVTKGKVNKGLLILALVGGGLGAAVVAVKTGGGSSPSPGAPPVPTSTSLSAGVLTVGAPR
jgi:hypothetical protein